eukprot:TRINITY_DN893_c0_g6_i1.p1 TRINITY_DN893_c0_g6~~TRINITY_DN893_c0_g6_i1.p1  ORF type:complete len:302 (-),score=93.33 TRINITY_DN893_c0_g6_i1:261-1097(-)
MELFKTVYPSEFYNKFLLNNVRPDGRSLDAVRKTSISVGSITSAVGSAFLKQGNTSITAGIKLEYGPPPPASSTSSATSQLVIGIELTPLCSSRFRPGKPSEQAQIITEQLTRLLASFDLLDGEQLVIEKGKAVWYLYADLYCLDYDGNLFDASLLALLAALQNVRLPKAKITEDELDVQIIEERVTPLKLKDLPVALTFASIDGHIIADPTSEEENFATTNFTLVYNNKGQLFSAFKPGGTPISDQHLLECSLLAQKRVDTVISLLKDKASSQKLAS